MMMTDCSSIQGSIASSSSDAMTLTTAASSWCAIPTSTRIRVVRLVRPHMRHHILLTPDGSPSYGFTVRGGKEFGTGFFVSSVERNSEAEVKGLHIGDQILRINGFRVDDAVHKEFLQFVASQDRITLKVRGVGMLPVKEKLEDRLSWQVVKTASVSSTPSESSYKSVVEREIREKEMNIVLNVAPRTKLGLGICKGPEWKPGIFVQFTKDKSVAREAGLRQGDQILSVNSIDFTDVLFSEAVAVMKGATKLEMIVRTGAGCELFPGESSGYNSSASSVTGDQSPCWADANSKRLTSVREEPTTATGWQDTLYVDKYQCAEANGYADYANLSSQASGSVLSNGIIANGHADDGNSGTTRREVNKTIIKLSESGTSINNTYITNPQLVASQPCATNTNSLTRTAMGGAAGRGSNGGGEGGERSSDGGSFIAAGDFLDPPPPPPPMFANVPPKSSSSQHTQNCQKNADKSKSNIYGNATTAAPARQNELKTVVVEVHRNAMVEENEWQKQQQQQQERHSATLQRNASRFNENHTNNNNINSYTLKSPATTNTSKGICPPKAPAPATASFNSFQNYNNNNNNSTNNHHDNNNINGSTLSSAITEELRKRKEKQQQQQQQQYYNINGSSHNNSYNNNNNNDNNYSYQNNCNKINFNHSQRDTDSQQQQNHQQQQQQQQPISTLRQQVSSSKRTPSFGQASATPTTAKPNAPNCIGGNTAVASDQHSALMDEFKRAHQRMFKRNGFHENEQESQERIEAFQNVAIKDYPMYHFGNDDLDDPRAYDNSPTRPKTYYRTYQRPVCTTRDCVGGAKPPNSPVPDYDNSKAKAQPAQPKPQPQSQQQKSAPSAQQQTPVVTSAPTAKDKVDAATTAAKENSVRPRRVLRLGIVNVGDDTPPPPPPPPPKQPEPVVEKAAPPPKLPSTQPPSMLCKSNLSKSNDRLDHQSYCPLRDNSNYAPYFFGYLHSKTTTTRIMDNECLDGRQRSNSSSNLGPHGSIYGGPPTGTNAGILKNGNRYNNLSKSTDKMLTFGSTYSEYTYRYRKYN